MFIMENEMQNVIFEIFSRVKLSHWLNFIYSFKNQIQNEGRSVCNSKVLIYPYVNDNISPFV